MSDAIEKVEAFIFNDDVQSILSEINSNLMDFNILEITGMGNQEIKHSNILAWLFDDSEHNLEYLILENFLKKIIEKNQNSTLQEYIYLSKVKKDIKIYREQNNIDLLIVDEANKLTLAIENKVYANEREDGNDGGQLNKYEDILKEQYKDYQKYFIYLTIGLDDASRNNWLVASHQMVGDILVDILKTKDITTKTKIIFESYIDLLKRSGIMSDKRLKDLCKKIWDNPQYREAFEIIQNNKPSKINEILNAIDEFKKIDNNIQIIKDITNRGVRNIHLKFYNESPLIYRIMYDTKGKGLGYVIVSEQKSINIEKAFTLTVNDKPLLINTKYRTKPESQHEYYLFSKYSEYFILDMEITKERVNALLQAFQNNDKNFLL